ncbi:hypothetical protein HPB51_007105 [Rhipicephalus microplus]|uniref:Uncharacterized protein n=1 Tax=Rhipicephalus microplus TaxID=6941 RepID=A0A9J6DZ83_RHIMP|nr:hypothetical protein HPB51_007105 [Rhipicephalus microplus]
MVEPSDVMAMEEFSSNISELSSGGDGESAVEDTYVGRRSPSEPVGNVAAVSPSTSSPSLDETSPMLRTEEQPTRPSYYIENILRHQQEWHTGLRFVNQRQRRRSSPALGGCFERWSLYWKQLRRDSRWACALDAFIVFIIIVVLFVITKTFMHSLVSSNDHQNVTRV